jgi:hypothetical protein
MIYVNSKPYKILSGKYILQIEQRKLIIEEIRTNRFLSAPGWGFALMNKTLFSSLGFFRPNMI